MKKKSRQKKGRSPQTIVEQEFAGPEKYRTLWTESAKFETMTFQVPGF